ncbi:MAG: TetR/AcrR family transcriptional regulator [Firmicutes bacterium]|nr:TetR/AcrR family transcriptional regulator [Bacillota bacterium]
MRKAIEERKQKNIKEAILTVAKNIIEKEGIEKVSIRKIANAVGYSPGNIYQYFKSKDDIIGSIVKKSYEAMIAELQKDLGEFKNSKDEIKARYINYINIALKNAPYYKAIMLNENPEILKNISVLEKGITKKRIALNYLKKLIEKAMDNGEFKKGDSELTAQIIWTSMFGLIIRLIIEKDISENQKERLINQHFEMIIQGFKKGDE